MTNSKLLDLLVDSLAVWRISHMLVHEVGPFSMLVKVRELAGIEHDEIGTPIVVPYDNVLGCVFCTSVWIGLAIKLVPVWARRVIALSAVSCILESRYG